MKNIPVIKNILASIRIIPIGTSTASIRRPVEESIHLLEDSGLTCKVNATCTELCGDFSHIMNATENAVNSLLQQDAIERVMCDVHLDVKKKFTNSESRNQDADYR